MAKTKFQHTQDWPDKSYTVVCKLGAGKLANVVIDVVYVILAFTI